jgi:hypothetical protein
LVWATANQRNRKGDDEPDGSALIIFLCRVTFERNRLEGSRRITATAAKSTTPATAVNKSAAERWIENDFRRPAWEVGAPTRYQFTAAGLDFRALSACLRSRVSASRAVDTI